MNAQFYKTGLLLCVALCIVCVRAPAVRGDGPNPVLNSVFPAGGRAGTAVDVTVSGAALDGLRSLDVNHAGLTAKPLDKNKFRITIPKDAATGLYDLRAVCRSGLSSPRAFFISNRNERLETEPNDVSNAAQLVLLNAVVNGRIEKGGDLDYFRFTAKQGQRIVIECWAERIDSQLRAVLEVYNAAGRRLAVNRGYFGIDPLIDFHVPADGAYIVKVSDLIHSGSADHIYRLDIDTGPRVAFAVPCVVQQGKTTRVTLYGWNLNNNDIHNVVAKQSAGPGTGLVGSLSENTSNPIKNSASTTPAIGRKQTSPHFLFDSVDVDITPPQQTGAQPLPVRLRPSQLSVDGFAYHYAGAHAPVLIGVTDVPVVGDGTGNHSPGSARAISFPCEVSGQLTGGDERDWFAINARRGEVIWIDAYGDRLDSPVDLDLSVLDAAGSKELARFSDELANIGGKRFPSNHLDPAGRWVAPADGRYLILVRNLLGSLDDNPRRVYRLSVRREVPDFHLAVVSQQDAPAGINVRRGGRSIVDVLAVRRRGLRGAIRVTAKNLPPGVTCPDIWLGPGITRAPLVITAQKDAPPYVGTLELEGHAESAGPRTARGGTVVRTGRPNGWGRMTAEIPLAVAGQAPLRITADGHETRPHQLYGVLKVRHSPGGILDVAVQIDRRDAGFSADVELIGVGLPEEIHNQTATIPAGKRKGIISFYLPPTLPVGRYTIAVRAQTKVPVASNDKKGERKIEAATLFSNAITFHVQPAAFVVEVDAYAPKTVKRGEIVKVNYTVKRKGGFIGKVHTELYAAGEVVGIRGRGVTFVGQTNSGTIQIIANDDAPFGRQPFLRLYAVGIVEDQPAFHGSCFLGLEIVK